MLFSALWNPNLFKMHLHYKMIFVLLFFTSSALATKCPTLDHLRDATLSQVDSYSAKVTWINDSSIVDWSNCVSTVDILVNNLIESTVRGEVSSAIVNMEPCKSLFVEIRMNIREDYIEETGHKVIASKKKFKTFLSPNFTLDATEYISLVQKSKFEAELSLKFDKVVENLTCKKVSRIEITVDEVGKDGERSRVHTNETETSRFIVWKLPLKSECVKHFVNIRLHGFGGTQPADLELSLQSFDSREGTPIDLKVVDTMTDKVSIEWKKIPGKTFKKLIFLSNDFGAF